MPGTKVETSMCEECRVKRNEPKIARSEADVDDADQLGPRGNDEASEAP